MRLATTRSKYTSDTPLTRAHTDEDNLYILDQGCDSYMPWLRIEVQDKNHLIIDKAYDVVVNRREAYILAWKLMEWSMFGMFRKDYPTAYNVRFFESKYLTPTCGKPSTAPRKRKARTPSTRKCTMAKKPAPKKPAPKGGKKTAC